MTDTNHNEERVDSSQDETEMLEIDLSPDPAYGEKGPRLIITPELDRMHLRAIGMCGESDSFLRVLYGDDVCDYRND
ncbi:MAG: hypothetical protein FJ267_18895 [Planctomycetes bacterium]|nr:hypothetical protein [Planctomycetota bacterium]